MASTHSADISLLATAAALATVDANVDTLATRLSAARAGYLDQIDGLSTLLTRYRGIVKSEADDINSSITSTSWATIDATVTMPAYSGETFSVLAIFQWDQNNGGNLWFELHGSSKGDQSTGNQAGLRPNYEPVQCQILRSGFAASEVVTIKAKVTSGGGAVKGCVGFIVIQETAN